MEDTATETTEAPAAEETQAKPVKVDPAKPCFCSPWEIVDTKDETGESVFTTGCDLTTKRTFAQGHDAKFVSFLVDGHFDGYTIQRIEGGAPVVYSDPVAAAALASDKLKEKAERAVANRQERINSAKARGEARDQARAEKRAAAEAEKARKAAEKQAAAEAKKAEKAAAPKDVAAQVVPGSQEGDAPASGLARIKVGRREYDAVIEEDGSAKYNDEKTGEERTIERDGYRLLAAA